VLFADVAPYAEPGIEPYVTQAATAEALRREIDDISAIMRRDLNPPPTSPLAGC
jgi:hypothetical protein